jgi:hypothetical protein
MVLGTREKRMNQKSDTPVLVICIEAVMSVALLTVFGTIISFEADGRSGEPAQLSTEARL